MCACTGWPRACHDRLGKRARNQFQQIQKYEKGTNRVGSGRLFEISVILGVSVLTLFEGGKATLAKGDDSSPFNLLADPLSLRLVQAFSEIQNGARGTRWSISSNR